MIPPTLTSPPALRRTGGILIAAAALAAVAVPLAPAAAHADTVFTVEWTGIGIYPRQAPDMASPRANAAVPDGTPITVECETAGATVDNGSGPNTIWERLDNGTFLPNAYANTGSDSWSEGVPRCSDLDSPATAPAETSMFDRDAAIAYAAEHVWDTGRMWTKPDCTYFASMILYAGGLPRTAEWNDYTTDPNQSVSSHFAWRNLPTKAAMSADLLDQYLLSHGLGAQTRLDTSELIVPGAARGDLIFYDENADGTMDHVAIVMNTNGTQTKVTQHTEAAWNKGWNWSKADNDWLSQSEPQETAYLVHITY